MRHMAAELKRKDDDTILLAIHPGEVATYVHLSSEWIGTDTDDFSLGIWQTSILVGKSMVS